MGQNPFGIRACATAALVLLLTTFAHAQNSQFLFDANGNLLVQTAEVIVPPQILAQPQNRIVAPDEAATFTVVAADTRLLVYQWRFNGTNISGATNDAVLLQNFSTNSEGEYRVVLTNPSGSVTSAPAMLWFDGDGDGMADSFELTYFGSLNQLPNGDFDGDGSSNLQEFLDVTNPTNTNSVRFHLTVVRDGGSVVVSPQLPSYTNGQNVTLTATALPGGEPFHAWLGDFASRDNPLTLVMTNNKTAFGRFAPVLFTWTNALSGDWNIATNWTPNLVPGSNDSVVIAVATGPTVTLNTSAHCNEFSLGNEAVVSTLTGNGTLTVHGHASWIQGTLSGSGRIVIEAGATLDVATPSARAALLNTRTLENGGTVQWIGAGSFVLNSSAVITNRPGALFQVQNASALQANVGVGRFDNAGTFRKSANAGTTTVGSGISFNNSGTVAVEAGTLLFNGGVTNSGVVSVSSGATNRLAGGGAGSGTFNALVNAVVEWTGGTFTLNSGALLNGAGLYRLNGGNVTADPSLTVENLDIVTSGTLGGTGTVTVASQMNWTGGNMSGGGRTIISPGATLNAAIPSVAILSGRTLENGGTISLTGSGNLGVTGNAAITNRPGGVFNFENESTFGLGGSANGRFDNAGTFRKSAGNGTSTAVSGLTFNNSGAVEIQTGTLLCNGGFTNNGVVNLSAGATNQIAHGGSGSGSFTAPATAMVEWTSGTFTLNSGAQLNGTGLYKLNGGNVTVNANLTVENLDLVHSSSSLNGTGAVTVLNGMNWTAGTMSGNGRTIIAAGVTLNAAIPSSVTLTSRTLENGGTVLWTGAGFIGVTGGAVITNRAGALFQAQNAVGIGGGIANGRLDNAGTFRKSDQTGATTFASGMTFNNSGMVDIRSGILAANGTYASSSNALLNCALGGTTAGTGYGQLQIAGAVTLNGALSVDFTNGFSPALNDSFTVLTAGTRNGAFGNFYYPSNAVTMQLSNTANSVFVRVADVLATIPQPMLLSPELTGSDFKLTWTAISNKTYRVEFNPNLAPSNWTALPGDVTAASNTASKLDPLTPSNRLYRVRVVP